MQHVRPHQVLELVNSRSYYDRLVTVVLPDRWSMSTIETAIILALAKYVQPKRHFEFGTYLGVTTITIAANLPEVIIETIDLDDRSFQDVDQHPNDQRLSEHRLLSDGQIAFVHTPFEERIHRLFGDSNTYDFSPYRGQMQMVHIDGGHDLRTVRSDTENAFEMLDTSCLGCVVWHDYGNVQYPELTQYLDDLALEYSMTHVEETTTVFRLHRP